MTKKLKTKNRKRDLDEIDEDIKPKNIAAKIFQPVDYDKPGCAQFYCVHCARYFMDDNALKAHFRSKLHKQRLKELETEPYTIEESKRAAGCGSYIAPKKRRIDTQPPKEAFIEEGVGMKVD